MKILAIILARKNSKRLKNKHHLNLGGKNAIRHTFDVEKKNYLEILLLALMIKKL